MLGDDSWRMEKEGCKLDAGKYKKWDAELRLCGVGWFPHLANGISLVCIFLSFLQLRFNGYLSIYC